MKEIATPVCALARNDMRFLEDFMKVVVKKKDNSIPVVISTEFIKLQDAMKFANIVYSGGEAKALIQEGEVTINGEVCTMRGKKLYPGDKFGFDGQTYLISIHS